MNFLNKYELKEILLFFLNGLKKGAISTRASSIAFNFFLAFFPALIFLFTLIPYIPVTDFQKKIFSVKMGMWFYSSEIFSQIEADAG